MSEAALELKWKRIQVLPSIGKSKQYPELTLTVIYAQERTAPKGRERIDWKLITDLPVRSRKDALRMLNWYALRWKIETFHKILKIRLQGGGIEITDCGTVGESDLCLLHSRLASLLDDDDQPFVT